MPELSRFGRRLADKVNAGFQLLSLPSQEVARVRQEFVRFGEATGVPVLAWDAFSGPAVLYPQREHATTEELGRLRDQLDLFAADGADFATFLAKLVDATIVDRQDRATGALVPGKLPGRCVCLLFDAHRAIEGAMLTRIVQLHSVGAFNCDHSDADYVRPLQHPFVFCQADASVHAELDHVVEPLRLPLLTGEEIAEHCVGFIEHSLRQSAPGAEAGLEGPEGAVLKSQIAEACRGLLDFQVNGVLSEAVRANGNRFSPACLKTVRSYRAERISASGIVQVYEGDETFDDVAGLTALKAYLAGILTPREGPRKAQPKGIFLWGAPGIGKSLLARAVGNSTGRIVLRSDLGALVTSAYGGTERNMRRLIDIAEGAGRCVLMLDEAEKMFAGIESSGKTDGGTTARAIGSFMQWSAERGPGSGVFLFATCNDLKALPPAFYRSGRFNAVFYGGMPSKAAKAAMWKMYLAKYDLDPKQRLPDDADWTGAEVANCCEQAYILGRPLLDAVQFVTRTKQLNAQEMAEMEEMATRMGAIDAELGGPFQKGRTAAAAGSSSSNGAAPGPRARKLGGIDPNLN